MNTVAIALATLGVTSGIWMALTGKLKWKYAILQVIICTIWLASYLSEGNKAAYIMIFCMVALMFVFSKWERFAKR